MNPFLLVAIKLLIGFLALVLIINITGKGNLAPSSASDQVVNYVLGGIVGGVIYNNSIKIYEFIVILGIWCLLVLGLKWVKNHNVKAKQLIDGKAHIIIDDGKILIENCKKSGLSAHERAIVEQNGQLIIIQSGEENPKFPIITDGQVQHDILKVIGKDEEWLLEELKKQGIEKCSDVFLGEYVNKQLKLTTY